MSVFWYEHHDWEDYGRVELPIEADLDEWEEYVEEGLNILAGLGPECDCDYPHGNDWEPPFETCTCVLGCSHYPTYDQEYSDVGEEVFDA